MDTVEITMNVKGENITIKVKNGTPETVAFIADFLATGLDTLEKVAGEYESEGQTSELPN